MSEDDNREERNNNKTKKKPAIRRGTTRNWQKKRKMRKMAIGNDCYFLRAKVKGGGKDTYTPGG